MNETLDKLMMCKYIISKYEITGQLDIYTSIEYVEEEYKKLESECEKSLKLQELVKESTKVGNPPIITGYLLKLVEESEN